MIEINLLPEEKKAKTGRGVFKIDPKQVLSFFPLVFGIVLILHLGLAGIFIVRAWQLNMVNNRWYKFSSEIKIVESFKKEQESLSLDERITHRLTQQRIPWAEKLNKLSLSLPSGVWFNELSLSGENFILKCSAISPKREEMNLINKFIDSLKNDPGFFSGFRALDLGSLQVRTVGGYDITDFILLGSLSGKPVK